MSEHDQTQVLQSSSAPQVCEPGDEMGTATLSSPAYSISSGDDNGEGESSQTGGMCFIDAPVTEAYGICSDPSMTEGEMAAQPDARATLNNIDPTNLGTQTFAGIINGLLGGPGSSANVTLEVGLGVGASIGVAEAFGGILLRLGAGTEIDNEGKFKISGSLGFGGYVRAEARWIFEAAVRRMGTITMEGEFESVNHFSEYVYTNIVRAAQGILAEMRAHISDRFIPDTLIELAGASVGRVQGPEVTTSSAATWEGEVGVGNEAGGASWTLGHSAVNYEKERDGRQTDRGTQQIIEGSHSIRIGDNEAGISFKSTDTDSVSDGNDKKEFELNISISGVANQLDELGCQRLTSLVDSASASVNGLASMAAEAGRSMLDLVSGGSIYTGRPTVPDLESSARGSLNLVFKWEKTTGDFEIKFAAVNFGYSMELDTSAQFPIPGTPLMGEGTANLNASFVRNIYLHNFR